LAGRWLLVGRRFDRLFLHDDSVGLATQGGSMLTGMTLSVTTNRGVCCALQRSHALTSLLNVRWTPKALYYSGGAIYAGGVIRFPEAYTRTD